MEEDVTWDKAAIFSLTVYGERFNDGLWLPKGPVLKLRSGWSTPVFITKSKGKQLVWQVVWAISPGELLIYIKPFFTFLWEPWDHLHRVHQLFSFPFPGMAPFYYSWNSGHECTRWMEVDMSLNSTSSLYWMYVASLNLMEVIVPIKNCEEGCILPSFQAKLAC